MIDSEKKRLPYNEFQRNCNILIGSLIQIQMIQNTVSILIIMMFRISLEELEPQIRKF